MNLRFAGLPRPGASLHMHHAGFGDVDDDESGTLIFDGSSGRISGGESAADNLFGAGLGSVKGRLVWEFIPDMRIGRTLSRHHAPAAAGHWARVDWQYVEALDVLKRSFEIAIHLSRRMTNGQEVFVLHFHRPGHAMFSPKDRPSAMTGPNSNSGTSS